MVWPAGCTCVLRPSLAPRHPTSEPFLLGTFWALLRRLVGFPNIERYTRGADLPLSTVVKNPPKIVPNWRPTSAAGVACGRCSGQCRRRWPQAVRDALRARNLRPPLRGTSPFPYEFSRCLRGSVSGVSLSCSKRAGAIVGQNCVVAATLKAGICSLPLPRAG